MGQSYFFRAELLFGSTLDGKEIHRFLWHLKCRYHVDNSLPLTQAEQEYPTYDKKKEGQLDCRNCLLKHVTEWNIEGRGHVEEVVSRYWMTKMKDTGI
jgi:hypothetical protein